MASSQQLLAAALEQVEGPIELRRAVDRASAGSSPRVNWREALSRWSDTAESGRRQVVEKAAQLLASSPSPGSVISGTSYA